MTPETPPSDAPEASRARQSLVSAILAVAGGVAWALCFTAEERLWLPWVALLPLMLLLGRRRPFWWGWVHGAVFWGVSLPWLVDTLVTFGGIARPLSLFLFVLLTFFLGVGHALFAWLGARLWHRGGWLLWLGLPAWWVVLEILRGLPLARFPWNLAAYGWIASPGVLPLASWVGALGVSWLLVWMALVVARGLARRRFEGAVWAVLATFLVLVLAGRFANAEPRFVRSRVLVVQPDTPILRADEAWPYYQRLIAMSHEACPPGSRALLVWPESAVWPQNYPHSARVQADVAALNASGCSVLLGAATYGPGSPDQAQVYNSALLLDTEGEQGRYSKRNLVPYGEYVPLAEVLPFVGTLARNAGSFTPGDSVGLLPWAEEQLAMAICYEVVFPGAIAEQVQAGATALVTITNDAWYGDTAAPHQHFRAARFRAAENRRPMLRAALTGISALVDARGAVAQRLEVGERDVLKGWLSGVEALSPYSRTPWLIPTLAFVLAGFAIVRSRSPVTAKSPQTTAPDGP